MKPRFVFLGLLFVFGIAICIDSTDVKSRGHTVDIRIPHVAQGSINGIVRKMVTMEKEIAEDRDHFLLFALFLREGGSDQWDLLVAAPWVSEDKSGALQYIQSKMQLVLSSDELATLSRIVLSDENSPTLEALQMGIHMEHGAMEVKNSNVCGLFIEHAFLITCRSENE